MNKDYSYCSGVTCPIRQECRRYLPDRRLPDKAIDLVDEACSRVRLGTVAKSPDIARLELRLAQVRADKAAAVASATPC